MRFMAYYKSHEAADTTSVGVARQPPTTAEADAVILPAAAPTRSHDAHADADEGVVVVVWLCFHSITTQTNAMLRHGAPHTKSSICHEHCAQNSH